MIPGVELELSDGKTYIFPPLPLASLELLQKELGEFEGAASPATIIRVALHSLKRNYPQITRTDLSGIVKEVDGEVVIEKPPLIDVSNMLEVMEAVMDISGVKRKEQLAGKVAAGKT